MHTRLLLGVITLTASLQVLAEPGTALKSDSLRAEPYADARTTGTLNKGDSVDILNKKGAWLQVKKAGSTGWVRLLSVKRGTTSGSGSAKGIVDVATGRAGTGKVVSTTGIRGLSADELKTAKFNEAEIQKMEDYAVSTADAQSFASAGGLSASNIKYLKGTP